MKPYYSADGIDLYLGDCREVLLGLDRSAIGAVVTDPPYGIAYRPTSTNGATWASTEIANDGDASARDAVLGWADQLPACVFGTWKIARPAGVREVLVWDKGPAGGGIGDLSIPWKRSWEEIYILGKGWAGHRGEGVLKGHWMVTWESRGRVHPNQKPVPLLCELIKKAPPGAILDPFAGSGSTLVAAYRLGRRAIGIEIEERYCEIAAKRIETERAQGALFPRGAA